MKIKALIVVCTALSLAGFLMHSLLRDTHSLGTPRIRFLTASAVQPQRITERIWRHDDLRKIWSIGDDKEDFLYGPVRFQIDIQGNIYVADYGDMRIKLFSSSGDLVNVFGSGRGQGPGELASITDIAISEDGLWVADNRNGRVLVFSKSGGVLRTVKTESQPYRLVVLGNGRFASMAPFYLDHLFKVFNLRGEAVKRFGELKSDMKYGSLTLDGFVQVDSNKSIYYAGIYIGVLAAYNINGELKYMVATIDPSSDPELLEDENSAWVSRDAKRNALSISTDGEYVHIYTYFMDGFRQVGAIDTYLAEDGTYLYSRRNPEPCSWLIVKNGYIYTAGKATISKWK
jgi:hypothetical protein